MIPEQSIQDIRERTDIVALIGEYVRLKKRGGNYLGLCPFHNEKTPSFNVHPARHFFHCFGCKASGDAISFLMRIEGLSFPEAARKLAERSGITVPELDREEGEAERKRRHQRERLEAIMEATTRFYEEALAAPSGAGARDELERRSITMETAKLFRLGYAPAAWDALATHLEKTEHSLPAAESLGLVGKRRDGRGYFDRFRNRLQFPVADAAGRIVAFSGRALPPVAGHNERPDQAKYINSPEGPLYKKGDVLFGLHQARIAIRRGGWAILCEGNFDLVALRQSGFDHVVAPLGTAFTAQQATLLSRYAERATLLFDGDNAGAKAVAAAYPLLKEAGIAARVALLPQGADPDSFLRERGAEALQKLLDNAPGIVEHMIDRAAELSDGRGAAERAIAVAGLGPILAAVKNPVEIDLYIQRVAQRFQIADVSAARSQLRQGVLATRRPTRISEAPTPEPEAPRPQRLTVPDLEGDLFGLLLDQPELLFCEEAKNLEELLTSPELRGMFRTTSDLVQEIGSIDVPSLISRQTDERCAAFLNERLAVTRYPDKAEALLVLQRGVTMLEKQTIESERLELNRQILTARRNGDDELADSLTKRRHELALRAHQQVGRLKR